MLNKPTNVSPYNDFVDIDEDIIFQFTLNNQITNYYLAVFSAKTNQILGLYESGTQIMFTKKTYSVLKSYITQLNLENNEDYYWRVFYWVKPSPLTHNTTSKATQLFEKPILDWDKSSRSITVTANPTEVIAHSYLRGGSGGSVYFYSEGLPSTYPNPYFNTLKAEIENGVEYWWNVSNDNDYSNQPTQIQSMKKSFYMYKAGIGDIYHWYLTPASPVGRNINYDTSFKANIFKVDDVTNGLCAAGDYVGIRNIIFKVESTMLTTGVGDSVNLTIAFTEDFPFDLSFVNNSYGTAKGYRNVDYNISPPYHFSTREPLDITLILATQNTPNCTVEAITPYFRGVSQGYSAVETDYYQYILYEFKNKQWKLKEKSSFYDTLDVRVVDDDWNQDYVFKTHTFFGLESGKTYKITLSGQTSEGMDFYNEEIIQPIYDTPTTELDFAKFNSVKGCVDIDNKLFTIPNANTELQIYRKNITLDKFEYVSTVKYNIDTTAVSGGLKKYTHLYDFNILSETEYIYYAFIISSGTIIDSFKSLTISNKFSNMYITDLKEVQDGSYIPDINNSWNLVFNYAPSDVSNNYAVNYPLSINGKYPKQVRGNSAYKTGNVSALIGNFQNCNNEHGEQDNSIKTFNKWEDFCNNGNPKLLRSYAFGENAIIGINSMSIGMFAYTNFSTDFQYTQIDDMDNKQIFCEV